MVSDARITLGGRPARARRVPVRRTVPGLLRDPLTTLEQIGRQAGGELVRLDLGWFRPYLVTHPDQAQHILRDNASNYPREGMMWQPLRRLLGTGLAGEGERWEHRRSLFRPLFSGKNVALLADRMAEAISAAVDGDLDPRARTGRPMDAYAEMSRIVYRVFSRIFFGDRLSLADAERFGHAAAKALTAVGPRMLMPFVPDSVPMPGDRTYRRACEIADQVMLPLIHAARRTADERDDILAILCRTTDLTDADLRDELVALFTAGTESTALVLTWLWVVCDSNPEVAARLTAEIEQVVGGSPVGSAHLPQLRYTKMALQEVLRLYPVGWVIPRPALRSDVIDGVPVKAGSTVLISPYVMHRLDDLWERPERFDAERFSPGRAERRHRFAYLPFGHGVHMCLGQHFFTLEAQLIVATLLGRYRPLLHGPRPVRPRPRVSLEPAQRVEMTLLPVA